MSVPSPLSRLPAEIPIEAAPPRNTSGRGDGVARVIVAVVASLFLLFIVAPLFGLVGGGGVSGLRSLGSDSELRTSLLLTIATATLATSLGMIGATPVAYALARGRFRGRALLAAIIDLPLLIPHPVAGIALLLVLGRNTALGSALWSLGLQITGSVPGIVCAMLFVSAPLYVSAAREAFDRVDPRFEGVARTLGDSRWRALQRVTLPM